MSLVVAMGPEFVEFKMKTSRLTRKVSALGFLALLLSGCVSAAEGRRMQQEIEALDARMGVVSSSLQEDRERLNALLETAEADIELLRAALEEAEQLLHRNSADLGVQLEGLGSDLDGLRGQIEHADFRLNQLQEQLNLFMEDVDLRLSSRRR